MIRVSLLGYYFIAGLGGQVRHENIFSAEGALREMDTILRINMTNLTTVRENTPRSYDNLGGRGLTARILFDEVDPTCNPLRKNNKLIIAPGLLAKSSVSSTGRLSVGAKSPLTGGIKESNAGGTAARKLARLGIKALIIEGKPIAKDWYILVINENGAEVISANQYRGLGNYALASSLRQRFGLDKAIISIGPAGEMGLRAAGVVNTDADGSPSRFAARGGLGSVMGSKHIKAIVIGDRGAVMPRAADPERFKKARSGYIELLKSSPVVEGYTALGTSAMVTVVNALGGLPTCNFRNGRFSGAESISGERIYELIEERKGKGLHSHACMPGCIIRCSNVYPDKNGLPIVSPLEYETLGLLGANCGIDDLDTIARLNFLCNDFGVDTIEIGAALGIAMEAGVVPFGDIEEATTLIRQIGQGTVLGRILGAGAVVAGKVFGVTRVPAVKGQAMPSYDPRAIKGTGVTYATSAMGADHTCGATARAAIDHLDPVVSVTASKTAQVTMAACDNLGLCMFASAGLGSQRSVLVDLSNAYFGWEWSLDYLNTLAREILILERKFNELAGFTRAHDKLPEYMAEEVLPEVNSTFDVSEDQFGEIYNMYSEQDS